ncbi:MAG TPA: phenylacetic acid degradation protein PaaN [Candidatus Baltobacteraceae bacterium]|nr:phenylacetic acid degradation protein PaaN [Candidatus Baltobacteraceae bacterium]
MIDTAPSLFQKHRATLDGALQAIRERTYWSAYSEIPSPKFYGETGRDDAEAAFKAHLRTHFELDQPSTGDTVGVEKSPYGFVLGVRYPKIDVAQSLAAAQAAGRAWSEASLETRAGVVLEMLERLNRKSWEIAFAVMHTTGQGLMMAFQAGGPHAQDRALEAVAYAYAEMSAVPAETTWEKPQGKNPPLRLQKRFRIVPRGVGLVIGCSTFPTWNAYPGLFADLVTGNAVVVKPHPYAILPLAISVAVLRDVLRENGFDPNVVQLAADEPSAPLAKELALRPEIGLIDYTGGNDFGDWLEQNVKHALVYTEKAGVNSIVIDSADDLPAMARNIAFSLTLYSGQMCTTPQNIFVPRDGIEAGGERVPFEAVTRAIGDAVAALTSVDEKAVELLGAIASEATLTRLDAAADAGEVVLASRKVSDARFPDARVRTPLILKVDAKTRGQHEREQFGPIAFVVPTSGTKESIAQAMRLAKERGAITGAIYSTDPDVLAEAVDAAADAGVALSCNLTGNIYVNQSAAFSDFHVSGANPAGNAALTDAQFVAGRFRIVQSRIPVAE